MRIYEGTDRRKVLKLADVLDDEMQNVITLVQQDNKIVGLHGIYQVNAAGYEVYSDYWFEVFEDTPEGALTLDRGRSASEALKKAQALREQEPTRKIGVDFWHEGEDETREPVAVVQWAFRGD